MGEDPMSKLHPIERAAVVALHDLWAYHYEIVSPLMDKRPEEEFRDPEVRNLQIAQNVLRRCLEAVLDKMLPYTALSCYELAIRLASYSISAAPLEDQDRILAAVLQSLPHAHSKRLASGTIIHNKWAGGGLPEQENVPGGRALILSAGPELVPDALYREAEKGEKGCICAADLFGWDLDQLDPMAIGQNLSVEVEKIMGIFPNLPPNCDDDPTMRAIRGET